MIEIERTYLAEFIPANLTDCRSKEIMDIYIPEEAVHPQIRLRKEGEELVLTKKTAPDGATFSQQIEQTITLTECEYSKLAKLGGKRLRKIRYYYSYIGNEAHVDIFKDALEGLVLVDFEFESEAAEKRFEMPDFCLADVTQEEFVAGGMLCGKSYSDIEKDLTRFGYSKLHFR